MIHRRTVLCTAALAGVGGRAGAQGASPELALKALIVGRRRPGMTLSEHRHHIRQVHGELVLRYIREEPDAAPRRYVQNPVVDGQFRSGAPAGDPLSLGRDFVTQVWFPSIAELGRSRNTPHYKQNIEHDEANFADNATAVFFPSRERQLFDRGAAPNGSWKLFVFVQRVAAAQPAAFVRAWTASGEGLSGLAGGAAVRRHVQNDVLGPPGRTTPADGIDEFWLDDEGSARALLASWVARLRETLVRPGLAAEGSIVGLIAREDVVFAGKA